MNRLIVLGLLATSAFAVPMPGSSGNLDCLNHEDMFSCIAVKSINFLGRAARSSDIQLIDGVTFVRDVPMERGGKVLETETELINELPREVVDKTFKLASMMFESVVSFLKSHSLKLSLPEGSIARTIEEARAKTKKSIHPLLAAAGLKIFALIPIALGGLALLVTKALFVGKIALLFAGILAFQKLFGSGSSTGNIFSKGVQPIAAWASAPASQSWSSAPSSSQSQGYYRSFDSNDAQHLAYGGQIPEEAK
ncbi:uncharacterized protein LOC107228200 isoform X2 [Neodiprion lecontei]|uniref:Uncharacterized protein LOC107228200 isoform X2 n=1 Tax=Neodiprion lecontei TaxID=441921 RepID=A0A6J0CF91_NEOLC|nr:uncharacterized protein LOC107228200 isoform X2 [Neodiprion lecontei]